MIKVINVIEHLNFEEANEHKEWRDEMKEEYESIMNKYTWDLMEISWKYGTHRNQMVIQT